MSKKYAYTKDQVLASLCRDSFFDFMKTFWHVIIAEEPVWNWHIEYLCEELQVVAERLFKGLPRESDLLINEPPGCSKSTVVSVMFPAWVWTRMPDCRFITASYAHALSLDLARKSRDVICSDLYKKLFPEVKIREDAATKAHFVNTEGGDRFSVGVNGSVTGMHAHFLIVDDPLDPSQAMSEVELKNADRWMRHTLPSRKVSKTNSVTVVVMQRLHQSDPSGTMLEEAQKEGSSKLRHICLPARLPDLDHNNVSPIELREKYIDGLMDPVRMPEATLKELEVRSAYGFAGQFMQSPSPIGGGLFKEHYFNNRCKAAPYNARRIRFWDRASSLDHGCYTVGILMAKCPEGNFYVEDMVRGQWEPHVRNKTLLATAQRDRARYGPGRNEPLIYIEREGGSVGRDAWKAVVRVLSGFHVIEDTVVGSKEMRAGPWSAQLAAGNVWIVDNGQSDDRNMRPAWDIQALIDEHLTFPNGKYMDICDACTGAFNALVSQKKMEGVLRTLSVRNRNKAHTMRIIVTPPELLAHVEVDEPALLLWFLDYDPNETSGQNAKLLYEGMDNLSQVHESTILRFDDQTVADNQEEYLTPLADGSTWADRVMLPEHGRQFWNFLLRPRTYGVGAVVMVDDKRRALSCALAFCAQMRFDPRKTIQVPGEVTIDVKKAPNEHAYRITKSSRGTAK